jgi:hypothetical protein
MVKDNVLNVISLNRSEVTSISLLFDPRYSGKIVT